jgi:hypothetical protein
MLVTTKFEERKNESKFKGSVPQVISPRNLPKSPPHITLENIDKMKNKMLLQTMETKYEEFIEQNSHILRLHDLFDEYLNIRDALSLKIKQIDREEKMKYYHLHYLLDNPKTDSELRNIFTEI